MLNAHWYISLFTQVTIGLTFICILIEDLELSHNNRIDLYLLNNSDKWVLNRIRSSHLCPYTYIIVVWVLPPKHRYSRHCIVERIEIVTELICSHTKQIIFKLYVKHKILPSKLWNVSLHENILIRSQSLIFNLQSCWSYVWSHRVPIPHSPEIFMLIKHEAEADPWICCVRILFAKKGMSPCYSCNVDPHRKTEFIPHVKNWVRFHDINFFTLEDVSIPKSFR